MEHSPKPSIRRAGPEPCRRDGWTVKRQAVFLQILSRTRSVSKAARAVGMSRESAYRLRARDPNGLFAVSWARVFPPRYAVSQAEVDKGHIRAIELACFPERPDIRINRAATSKP
jgi:hypothetical protein